ncbi:MAG: ATP synthase subunit [Azospirillum sp.]|nr:ATP synthase subunit [Azospirillum sp.]
MTADLASPQPPDPVPPPPQHPAGLNHAVTRFERRRAEARREGEPSLGRHLAMMGAYGWILVTPTLIGLFLGRWLDDQFNTGITFAAALIMAGVAFGFRLVWLRMHQP